MIGPKTVSRDDLSEEDKVLISLYKVSNGTTERVPFEDLVLQAWRDFPQDFSLPRHPEFPDASIINKRLYSLKTKRLIMSLRNRVYRLSEKGMVEVQTILRLGTRNDKNNKKLSLILNRDEEKFLENALRSNAFSTWKKGDKSGLIDYDVRVFFQFSTGTPVKERRRKVENARDAIQKAIALDMPEATVLNDLFQFLIEKFPILFGEI
jgi:hypothetical protein